MVASKIYNVYTENLPIYNPKHTPTSAPLDYLRSATDQANFLNPLRGDSDVKLSINEKI